MVIVFMASMGVNAEDDIRDVVILPHAGLQFNRRYFWKNEASHTIVRQYDAA